MSGEIPVIQIDEVGGTQDNFDLGEETIKIEISANEDDVDGEQQGKGGRPKNDGKSENNATNNATNNPESFFVTEEEIEAAFKFFSGDGKKITRDDLKSKLDLICPQLSLKDYKLFFGGAGGFKSGASAMTGATAGGLAGEAQRHKGSNKAKPNQQQNQPQGGGGGALGAGDGEGNQDLMGLRELKNLLLNKDVGSLHPLEEAFRMMEVDDSTGAIATSSLKKMLRKMNKHGFTYKTDYPDCLQLFDIDRDGHIGFEDYKNIKPFNNKNSTKQ